MVSYNFIRRFNLHFFKIHLLFSNNFIPTLFKLLRPIFLFPQKRNPQTSHPKPKRTMITTLKENHDFTSLFLTLSAIFAFIWYAWIKPKNPKTSALPPGPMGLPLVGNLLSLDPEVPAYFASLAQTYGPIFKLKLGNRLGIVVTSPPLAREVLKENDVTFANRNPPDLVQNTEYGGPDIVWSPYGREWRMLRKVCVLKMLGNTTLDSLYSLRRREVRKTVSELYGRVGSPVEVGEQIFLTILNVITNMLWGGTLEGEERANLGLEFREVVTGTTELLGKPNISDFFPGLARFDLQGLKRQIDGLGWRLDHIFERVISQRMKIEREGVNESNKDFLQFLLRLKDEEDSQTPLTMRHVKGILTVCWPFLYLFTIY